MNENELKELARAIERLIGPHLEASPALRRAVAEAGAWLSRLAATGNDEPAEGVGAGTTFSPTDTVPMRLGDHTVDVPVTGTAEEIDRARRSARSESPADQSMSYSEPTDPPIDLELVERRCRLKADSCRLLIERRAAASSIDPTDREQESLARLNAMIAEAKAMPGCFLWAFTRDRPQPGDTELTIIAETYEAHADAASLVRSIDAAPTDADDQADALALFAEANSALRAAVELSWLPGADRDQSDGHRWLRRESSLRQIFIERHMTMHDPADPSRSADLRARIKALRSRIDLDRKRNKTITQAINRIRYHAGRVADGNETEALRHWKAIDETVTRLEELGLRRADRRIAEAIGSEAATSPAAREFPKLVGLVTRALDRPEPTSSASIEIATRTRTWSSQVLHVREMLRGRNLVVVGGEPRPDAISRFIEAFALDGVDWVPLSEHGSSAPMLAPIQNEQTALVLVIVKLTGHLHADMAREYARSADTPCVMLTAGYNPEQIAQAVLEQASDRLTAATGRATGRS
ncbi:MAG TPA: hypothetical protein ENJ00_01490 [Phycisphaerales bacterium]|nr:hypothetical protein [Phycisphaerales bacterium]